MCVCSVDYYVCLCLYIYYALFYVVKSVEAVTHCVMGNGPMFDTRDVNMIDLGDNEKQMVGYVSAVRKEYETRTFEALV